MGFNLGFTHKIYGLVTQAGRSFLSTSTRRRAERTVSSSPCGKEVTGVQSLRILRNGARPDKGLHCVPKPFLLIVCTRRIFTAQFP
jgi:hypothetical protein